MPFLFKNALKGVVGKDIILNEFRANVSGLASIERHMSFECSQSVFQTPDEIFIETQFL
jgi:hypothetical protein